MRFFAIASAVLLGAVFAAPTEPRPPPPNFMIIKDLKFQIHEPKGGFQLHSVTLSVDHKSTICGASKSPPYTVHCVDPNFSIKMERGGLYNYVRDKWQVTASYEKFHNLVTRDVERARAIKILDLENVRKGAMPKIPSTSGQRQEQVIWNSTPPPSPSLPDCNALPATGFSGKANVSY